MMHSKDVTPSARPLTTPRMDYGINNFLWSPSQDQGSENDIPLNPFTDDDKHRNNE